MMPDDAFAKVRQGLLDDLAAAVAGANDEELRLLRELAAPILAAYRERRGAWDRQIGPCNQPDSITITGAHSTQTLSELSRLERLRQKRGR